MKDPDSEKLFDYAHEQLGKRLPTDTFSGGQRSCKGCEGKVFKVVVETHEESEPDNFAGRILSTCVACGEEVDALGVYGAPREAAQTRRAGCKCGSDSFAIVQVVRFDEGFFDNGVIVAGCAKCGKEEILARTE